MRLTENGRLLSDFVVRSIREGETPTEGQLKEHLSLLADKLADMYPTSEVERAEVLNDLLARLRVSMDVGTSLREDDVRPWLDSRRASIDPFYWVRFKNYLEKDWSPGVLRTFDKVTDEILDLCGNPAAEEESWKRRGLVIGDVQSGKTATYTALCCKAADAGYEVIVLLAGSLESLRRQTQKRLDEGFAGLDSSEFLPSGARVVGKSRAVGAGVANQTRFAAVFTSRSRDFNKDVLNSRQLTLRAVREPVLFVVKKHKSIIENLATWLQAYNADTGGKISESLLLIDDEADNASINTNDVNADPTAINRTIRHLLSVFKKRTYVGFTATPFANVFIDPETSDADFHKEELFPRDFIYALEAPTNYIGAARVFGEDRSGMERLIHEIEDADDIFPPRHKSSLHVAELPQSIHTALLQFCIANVLRDLRGDVTGHRSMLVNVSRFTAVQDRVRDLIDAAIEHMKQEIRSFSKLSRALAMRSDVIARIKHQFDLEYSDSGFSWQAVQAQLFESTAPISVRSVNQRTGAASLDYSKHDDTGLRVIAVGGNSLSRGLTLEGLCVSYFFRNAQAYDTLMQMGRWFGYRKGYEDLCRLWITEDAQHWYGHVALATEELRDEVRRMRRADLTPKDFGLKVRSHPDTLIVTARNKMRTAENFIKQISWSAESAETTKLRTPSNPANCKTVQNLFDSFSSIGLQVSTSEWGSPIIRSVPKELVGKFIDSFEVHPQNFKLYVAEDEKEVFGLGKFVRETTEPNLQLWDVVIPKGEEARIKFLNTGIEVSPVRRAVTTRDGDRTILVSGAKARVGSRGLEREGLPKALVDELTEQAKPYIRSSRTTSTPAP
jgi:Z1 domain